MRSVVWSQEALNDLDRVIAYIAANNPAAARRVADLIEKTGSLLGDMATGRPGRVTGTYEKIVPGLPYILAYRLVSLPDGTEAVAILRAIHDARNWPPDEWPDHP